jgi:cytidylate kinase
MMRVVAIDGPAASGKSSTAKAVARVLGFHHLDSGALYRTLTRVALDAGLDPDNLDVPALLAQADRRGLGLRPEGEDFVPLLDGAPAEHLIRTPEVTAAVSAVSAVPEVRDWANARMRALAEAGVPIVVDGRDIGSVVFPEARLKVFLYAKSVIRAMRRLAQQGGKEPSDEEILAEAERLKARDEADRSRPVAPLTIPDDAVELDSGRMTFDEQVDGIARLARAVYGLPAP